MALISSLWEESNCLLLGRGFWVDCVGTWSWLQRRYQSVEWSHTIEIKPISLNGHWLLNLVSFFFSGVTAKNTGKCLFKRLLGFCFLRWKPCDNFFFFLNNILHLLLLPHMLKTSMHWNYCLGLSSGLCDTEQWSLVFNDFPPFVLFVYNLGGKLRIFPYSRNFLEFKIFSLTSPIFTLSFLYWFYCRSGISSAGFLWKLSICRTSTPLAQVSTVKVYLTLNLSVQGNEYSSNPTSFPALNKIKSQ